MSSLDPTFEAEQYVVGALLRWPADRTGDENSPRTIDVVSAIDESHFQDPRNALLIEYIFVVGATLEPENINFTTVRDRLLQDKMLTRVGNGSETDAIAYMVELAEMALTNVDIEYHMGLIQEGSLRRRTASLGMKASQTALDLRTPPEDALSSLIRDAEGLLAGAKTEDNTAIGDDIIQNEMSLYDGSFIKPISCGFWKVDTKIVGLTKSEMTLIGARPQVGKTAMAENMSTGMAEKGIKVGFLSAEMKKQSLYERMIASRSRTCTMTAKAFAMGMIDKYDDSLRERRLSAAHYIKKHIAPNMWIDDTPGMDIRHIERLMAKPDKRVDVLFVDHLHHISRSEDKADIDVVVKTLYDLGRRYGHHTVLLAQLNRSSVTGEKRRPRLSDLKGSGVIEQVANNVFLIDRPEEDDGTAEIIVSKARDGCTGICNIYWNGESTRFTDVPEL